MSTERIVNVKIINSTNGFFDGPPIFFVELENGEDVPLFEYDEKKMNYTPSQFIGLSVQEASQLKRLKDLIWFGTVIDQCISFEEEEK